MDWINIEDDKPHHSDEVLVWVRGFSWTTAWCNSGTTWYDENGRKLDGVVAWMEIEAPDFIE